MRKYINGKYTTMSYTEELEIMKSKFTDEKAIAALIIKDIISPNPRVEVILSDTLTISVDGSRISKDNFKTKWEMMLDTDLSMVKDFYNKFHQNITKSQIELIWKAIVINGELMYAKKWEMENKLQLIVLPEFSIAEDLVKAKELDPDLDINKYRSNLTLSYIKIVRAKLSEIESATALLTVVL